MITFVLLNNPKMKQFELFDVQLHPARGSEQRGIRPCVVLQTNASSGRGGTTIIAPLTTKKLQLIYPFEVLIEPSKQNGLVAHSKIKLDQIRVISFERTKKRRGHIEEKYWKEILEAVDVIFDRDQLYC